MSEQLKSSEEDDRRLRPRVVQLTDRVLFVDVWERKDPERKDPVLADAPRDLG